MRVLTISKILMATAIAVTIGNVNAAQAGTISAAPNWDGNSSVSNWGIPDTSTYGQTFTVQGAENVLQKISFQIGQTSSPIPYAAYIAKWVGGLQGKIDGPLLYSSGAQSFSNPNSLFQQVSFNTGGLTLETGRKYVAFLSTSGLQSNQSYSTTYFGNDWNGSYAGGEFVFYNNGNDFNSLLTNNWQTFFDFGDLAFKAELTSSTAVPTPALLPGLIGLGLTAARKRKQKAAAQKAVV